jgi:hypothetical protein
MLTKDNFNKNQMDNTKTSYDIKLELLSDYMKYYIRCLSNLNGFRPEILYNSKILIEPEIIKSGHIMSFDDWCKLKLFDGTHDVLNIEFFEDDDFEIIKHAKHWSDICNGTDLGNISVSQQLIEVFNIEMCPEFNIGQKVYSLDYGFCGADYLYYPKDEMIIESEIYDITARTSLLTKQTTFIYLIKNKERKTQFDIINIGTFYFRSIEDLKNIYAERRKRDLNYQKLNRK